MEPTSQQVGVRETLVSRSESYRSSPSWQRWKKGWPSDDQKRERTASSPRMVQTVGAESDQHVNICSLLYIVIICGLALNDTVFILVQATCPTSSLSRSLTLFLSLGAQSLQWGYKREGERRGVQEVQSAPVRRAKSDKSYAMS